MKSNLRSLKLQLLNCAFIGAMFGVTFSTIACEVITSLSEKGKLTAKVSANKINRLELSGSPVAQIIGDESRYSILTDEIGMNIFFVPKVPAGEDIELSLVDSTGAVIDLFMHVENIAGQVIKIGKDKVRSTTSLANQSNLEMADILKCMIKDETGKYYRKLLKRKIANKTKGVKIIQDRSYRFGDLEGARLLISNESVREGVIFVEENFKSLFEGLKVVSVEQRFLGIGRSGYVYVIAEGVAK